MPSIENIKASDGSGNANMATIQSSRSSGATTIDVDTVLGINPGGFAGTMGTPHTFTDPITSETITVISEATAVDFTGHVDGSNLEIDDIAPGYVDDGSIVGDIVIIRPTTQWGDEVADILEVAHNDDGSLKPFTSPKIITSINDTNNNELLKLTATSSAVNELTLANAATGNSPSLAATGGDTNIDINLTPKGTGAVKLAGSLPWRYLGSATYTGGTVTSSGATPTLVTSLTTQVTIPSGCTAVRITVQLQNLYLQTGDGLGTIRVYSGATSGALTTVVGEVNGNIGAGGANNFGVVPATLVALKLSPSAGSIYYSAAIHASTSNAKTDSSSTAPALILVEVC